VTFGLCTCGCAPTVTAGCARASSGCLKKFVHVSTAMVYKSEGGGRAAQEDARLAPWTQQAEFSLAA
jgi:hypothetical protein